MEIFPKPIQQLPHADIPLKGVKASLSQSENHQILFMEFHEDVELQEHSHECQWSIVLEGQIDLVIDGIRRTFSKRDRYFIDTGIKHSGRIHAGYADITFFNEPNRYKAMQ